LLGFLLLLIILFVVIQLFIQLLKSNWVGSLLQKMFPKAKSIWERVSSHEKVKEILSSLVIGLIVAFAIHVIHTRPVIMDIEDASMDWVMKIREGILSRKSESPQFVILDVDDDSHRNWGYPLFTPRNHIKALIETAVQGGAQLVIVDADLSQKTPFRELQALGKVKKELNENEKKLEEVAKNFDLHPFDQELYNYIYNYKKNCEEHAGQQQRCVPIILVGPPMEKTASQISRVSRIGFLADAVENSKPYVQWASALFFASQQDRVVRRWSLWQPVCMIGKDKQPEGHVIPSIELLATTWFKNGVLENFEPKKFQDFQDNVFSKTLEPFRPSKENCTGKDDEYNPNIPKSIEIGKLKVSTGEGIGQRIIYSMPWKDQKGHQPPELPYELPYMCEDKERNDKCVLKIASAWLYTDQTVRTVESVESLNAKVVLIGGSYGYSEGQGDIHPTPLGNMLGGLVLINAIYSILQFDVEGLSVLKKLGIEAILILLISLMIAWVSFFWVMAGLCGLVAVVLLCFAHSMSWIVGAVIVVLLVSTIAYFSPFVRMVFSGMICVFLLLPLSIMWFEQGIWLDFAIPLIAVQFHHIADAFEAYHKHPKKQHHSS